MNQRYPIFITALLPEADILQILKNFDVGLELIQFSISDNLDHYAETLEKEKAFLDRLGHPKTTVHGPFLDLNPMAFDSKIQAVTMERFKAARDGALSVGAEKIIFHSGMIPTVYYTEGWADRVSDFWNDFLKDHSGIKVCMENVLDWEYLPLKEVMENVTHPDFEFCLDAAHAHCYSHHSAEEWAAALKNHIGHVHLHDNKGDRDAHLALNAGNVPWRTIIDLLLADRSSVLQNDRADSGKQTSKSRDLTFTLECYDLEATQKSLLLLQEKLAEYPLC